MLVVVVVGILSWGSVGLSLHAVASVVTAMVLSKTDKWEGSVDRAIVDVKVWELVDWVLGLVVGWSVVVATAIVSSSWGVLDVGLLENWT